MMNRIDNSGEGIARLGRDEDNYLAHVAQGEMVVPPVITPETRQRLEQDMMNMGLDPNEYTVGGGMSINPITGNPEFGFLKKIAKSLKKVVKKIAPVAAVIPGPWQGPAIAYNRGRAVVNIAKGEGGIGDLMTAFTPNKAYTGGKTGNIFGNTKEFFTKGADGVGFFENLQKGIGGLKDKAGEFIFKGDDDTNIFGNLRNMITGGQQETMYEDQFGNEVSAEEYANMNAADQVLYTEKPSSGNLFSNIFKDGTPESIKSIEDMIKKGGSFFGDGKGGLGNAGIAGLAGLIGKMAYDEAKDFKGVPLTPLTTTDQLGRYNIAAEVARQKGDEMPSRAEFGLNPSTLPILQGGGFDKTARKPIGAAAGGIMSFANGGEAANSMVQQTQKIMNNLGMDVAQDTKIIKNAFGLSDPMMAANILQKTFKNKYPNLKEDDINNLINYGHEAFYREAYLAKKQAEQMNMGGIMAFAEGGAVAMAEGGELPIDPANFPVMDGQIDGPGTETSDDIPAMLSDGEFVMTAKAVKGAGGFNVAANDSNGIVTLTPNGEPSRDSGTRVMYKLMEHFGGVA